MKSDNKKKAKSNKKRKIPLRTCVGCRNVKFKQELIRIVRTPSGEVKVDVSGKANGRGAYLCINEDCFLQAVKKKALAKGLGMDISENILRQLKVDFISCIEGIKMVT